MGSNETGKGWLGAVISGITGAISGSVAQDIAIGGISTVGTATLVVAVSSFATGAATDVVSQSINDDVGLADMDYGSVLQSGVETAIFATASIFLPVTGKIAGDAVLNTVYNMMTSAFTMGVHAIQNSIEGRKIYRKSLRKRSFPYTKKRMKYRLSFHQRYPFYLGIIGIPFLYIIAILNLIDGLWYLAIKLIVMTILLSIPMRRLSMALCFVVFTEEGVSVESKKRKKRIFLKWEEIKVYTVTADVKYGGQYICLSSNANIKELRTYFFGVVWAIYEEKNTISLPTDSAMISFCSKKLEPFGVQVKYTRNPNTRQF